jgi:hypothetical protein
VEVNAVEKSFRCATFERTFAANQELVHLGTAAALRGWGAGALCRMHLHDAFACSNAWIWMSELRSLAGRNGFASSVAHSAFGAGSTSPLRAVQT